MLPLHQTPVDRTSRSDTSTWAPLEPDECHVWCADLRASADQLPCWERSLSTEELDRAARFRFAADRDTYVTRHGILRCILNSYLQIPPGELRFVRNTKGKPELHPGSNPLDLRFNLSRSGNLAVFALARGHEVGVDVESLRFMPDWESIAKAAFSPAEFASLGDLPANQRFATFLSNWTRKESILKALGDGIAGGMRHIEVELASDGLSCLPNEVGRAPVHWQWTLEDLELAPDYVGAVAVKRTKARIACRLWAK